MKEYKYDVFISYSRKDLCFEDGKTRNPDSIVSKILDTLDENRISYWIDLDGIYVGNRYAEKIAVAIDESRTFLFVSTSASNCSSWTAREIASATNMGRTIFPFKTVNTPYPASISLYLSHLDHIDYTKLGEKSFQILVKSLQQALREIYAKEAEEEAAERRKIEETSEKQEKERQLKLKREKLQARYDVLQELFVELCNKKDNLLVKMLECGMDVSGLADVKKENISQTEDDQPKKTDVLLEEQYRALQEKVRELEEFIAKQETLLNENGIALKKGTWERIKEGFRVRPIITSALLLIALVVGWFCIVPCMILTLTNIPVEYRWDRFLVFASMLLLIAVWGGWQILKMEGKGVVLLFISFWLINSYFLFALYGVILFSLIPMGLFISSFFIKKNGQSTWQLLGINSDYKNICKVYKENPSAANVCLLIVSLVLFFLCTYCCVCAEDSRYNDFLYYYYHSYHFLFYLYPILILFALWGVYLVFRRRMVGLWLLSAFSIGTILGVVAK